ncbi:MAG: LUD domain-containing protein [Puia sp.]|nr:LUD domain-containing protein [Puia sp.]
MSSREKILSAIRSSQPAFRELPALPTGQPAAPQELAERFSKVLEAIGGAVYFVPGFDAVAKILKELHPGAKRIVSDCPELAALAERPSGEEDPHSFEDIDVTVLRAQFGVAENGACWITEERMIERAVPFICQHLALVIDKKDIVPSMHEAYDRIAGEVYGFGTFIAGPSKTADIEQSLVLGAHGPRSMVAFVLDMDAQDAGFY